MLENLAELIDAKKHRELKKFIAETNVIDLAGELEKLSKESRVIFFRMLPKDAAADIFSYLSLDTQEDLVGSLTDPEIGHIVNDLFLDDAVDFIEEMPSSVVKRVLRNASNETRKQINYLLQYKDDSAGSMMTTEYVDLKEQMTVVEAFKRIREVGMDKETIYTCYVTDASSILDGVVTVRTLLLARETDKIGDIMSTNVIAARTDDDREHVADLFQKYDLIALPVTDMKGYLVGIVTVDDAMEVLEEESTEDFHKFGGTEELDVSYTRTPLLEMIKKRAGWLVILFLGEMMTASAMGHFNDEIARAVVLALFVPLIISSGGNSGSQAASLIIRSLALDELRVKNWVDVLRKELLSGFLLGAVLGVIGFVRVLIWQKFGLYDYGEYWAWIGLCITISLICVVMWGTLSGSMVPILLKRIGLDPAAASAPFVATLVDVTGIVIYFSVAALFLSGKLL